MRLRRNERVYARLYKAEGEAARPKLAVFLHGTHARTTDALKARAMPEPDSKGG